MTAALAAFLALVMTGVSVALWVSPAPQLTLDTETEVVAFPARGMAVLALVYALLWWLPALGLALRQRWGASLGIGTALLTLLFAAATFLLLGREGSPTEWLWPAAALAFLILAGGLRRQWPGESCAGRSAQRSAKNDGMRTGR